MFGRGRRWHHRRLVQIAALAMLMPLLWLLLGGGDGASALVRSWHEALVSVSRESPAAATAAYVVSTAVAKLTPLTGGGLIMVLGGYLFGTIGGGVLAAIGAAMSAVSVAVAGRRWFSEFTLDRRNGRFERTRQRLLDDGFSYYLALRLFPVVPAWITNLVPVVVPLPLWQVGLATFIGVLPISLIAAQLGSGIADIAARDEMLTARVLLEPSILLPLLALAFLVLLTPFVRQLNRRRAGSDTANGELVPPGRHRVFVPGRPASHHLACDGMLQSRKLDEDRE